MNPIDYFFIKLYEWSERNYRKIDETFHDVIVTPELVADRFKLLFKLHGIEVSEIPEVNGYQDITIHDLNVNDRLLKKLTPKLLEDTAYKFGVRIEWLRSGEAEMYSHRQWYKNELKQFFEDLKDIDFEKTYDPFVIITTTEKFDVHSTEYQPFILVLRKHLSELGEKDIYQYSFESVWDWHHPPCRLQAKGIATKYYELTHRMIPIYKTTKESFYKIQQGYVPPNVGEKNHRISFEEYGNIESPHIELYENEEFDAVVNEMDYYKINSINYDYLNTNKLKKDQAFKPKKAGRKPNKEKRELKDRFIGDYREKIENGVISCAQAARDFFDALAPEEEKLLFRSEKNLDTTSSDELCSRAERTLTNYYREFKTKI